MSVDVDILTARFPRDVVKSKQGKFDYIDQATCIRRLNEATGNQWDFEVKSITLDPSGKFTCAHCKLTIPGLGSREHIGVMEVNGSGADAQGKGAVSDGMKKCASMFGVALELYGDDVTHDQPARNGNAQPARNSPTAPQKPPTDPDRAKLMRRLWEVSNKTYPSVTLPDGNPDMTNLKSLIATTVGKNMITDNLTFADIQQTIATFAGLDLPDEPQEPAQRAYAEPIGQGGRKK